MSIIIQKTKEFLENSVLFSALSKFGSFFESEIEKSVILEKIKTAENSDQKYLALSNKLNFAFLKRLKKSVAESQIFVMLKYFTDNFLCLPCSFYGVVFLIMGLFGVLNSQFILHSKLLTYLSCVVVVFGVFFVILKKSLSEIGINSLFIGNFIKFISDCAIFKTIVVEKKYYILQYFF